MEGRRFRCPSCNETFSSAEELRIHGENHAKRAQTPSETPSPDETADPDKADPKR